MRAPSFLGRAAGVAAGGVLLALAAGPVTAFAGSHPTTVVYTESDADAAQGGNAVLAFASQGDRHLVPIGSFATGGAGSGTGLGSQGALAIADGGRQLLAVNAGSGTVSDLAVRDDGTLVLRGSAPSGGTDPISVTVHGRLVEVLDAGSLSIAGLELSGHGITALTGPGSTARLSAGASFPEQVSFGPGGHELVVTEKGSNTLDTFSVTGNGRLGTAVSTVATGGGPYGFDFDRWGHAVVSDAGPSAVTTYELAKKGVLVAVSFLADGQAAACWLVVGPDGDHAYTANAGSGNISSYAISASGALRLERGVATDPGGKPLDLAIGGGRLFINVHLSGSADIYSAGLDGGGRLDASQVGVWGLPVTATGLVAVSVP